MSQFSNSSELTVRRARPGSRDDEGGFGGYSYSDDSGFGGSGFGDDEGGEGRKRYSQIAERNRCRFCREKLIRVDYKDILTLQKLCTNQGRLFSRKRSGNCASHQRMLKKAIKQARFIGLLPYTA
ncbi:MAG TPA: 30S ribosomal protein S18 [Planctomycetota bacterium]|jgi:small subunit ribosomal protein S18|nr:30S ribosomal protein S18 [Planctomycetota bacterium]